MPTRLGYLLPTREKIMAGEPATEPLLDLAARAERLGFDAIWVGDSLFARQRHEPLTLMTAIAARLNDTGQLPNFGGPAEFHAAIELQRARVAAAAKELGIVPTE